MRKKYLVTGGTGFIGSALTRRLIKEGHTVRVFDNNSRGSAHRLRDLYADIEFIRGDIRDLSAVEKAVQGVDCVFHLAFVNGTEFFYSKPELVLDVGVKGMCNIMDACKTRAVKDFILASSAEVYQTPPNIPTDETVPLMVPDPLNVRYSYGGAKLISELIAINYGRHNFDRVTIFRPHNIYGPDMGREHVVPRQVINIKELCVKSKDKKIDLQIQGVGTETRAFCYIDDLIDALILLDKYGKHLEIYHIGTMEETAIANLVTMIGNYFGREINIVPGELSTGSTLRRCPNIEKMKNLGYEPKILLSDGVWITARWYDEHSSVNTGIHA